MNKIFTALYSHFAADVALHASVSDLYNTEAPEEAVFPYLVMSITSNTPDIDSSQRWENYLIQFNIFSNKSSVIEINAIFELLKGDAALGTGFDYFQLVIDQYTTVILERKGTTLSKNEGVWQITVLYDLKTVYTGLVATEIFVGNLYNLLSVY